MERELIIKWIYKALDLDLGDKIFIPMETRENSFKEIKQFNKELEILSNIDPKNTGTIKVVYSFKDKTHWLILERTTGSPLIGFVKKANGTKSRVTIQHDPERERKLKLMKETGFTIEMVEIELGELTTEEKRNFCQ